MWGTSSVMGGGMDTVSGLKFLLELEPDVFISIEHVNHYVIFHVDDPVPRSSAEGSTRTINSHW